MAGYTRQSTFADGDTITAALFNNEYNQLVNAFSNTTGHSHDGTAASGPVIGLIGDAGETSPNNKVLIDTTNNYIEFYVEVSSAPVQQLYIADGAIIPVTDSDIDLGTTSLRFKDTYTDTVTTTGNVSIGGDLTVTGSATISGNLTFGDADTDSINLAAEIDSDIIPNTDGTYDLGSATKEWQDLYIDGTANIDSLVADTADINGGTIDGATIATSDITVGAGKTLDVSSGTLTLADNQISGDKVEGGTIAATTITTLTSTTGNITNVNATTVDSTNLEVTNLKAKDGTSAGSIADSTGVVTLASSVLTTTDINGGTIDGVTIGGSSAGAVTFTDLSDGTITIAGFADEDNMASDSATLLPTQQSVKAYVDSQVTAQDLDFQGDTGGALSIDLDSESLTIAGGTGIDTSGATNTLTVAIDSTVATLTGTQTLTNKTLTTPIISSISNTGTLTLPTSTDTLVGRATTDTLTNKTLTSPTLTSPVINTGVSGTAFLDDDTFATASATTLASSESIKAYVDAQILTEDTLAELNDTNITSPADGALLFYDTGTSMWIDNVVSGDITIADTGVAAISSGVIVNDDINASAAISISKTALVDGTGLTLTGDTLSVDAAQTQITSVGTLGSLTVSGDVTVDTNTLKVDSTNNRVGILNATPDVTLDIGSATDAVHLPVGTTAQRPASPAAGYFRYNSTTGKFEGYTDDWGQIGGGSGTNMDTNIYAGDGSTVNFTLSTAPDTEQNLMVFIDGVFQAHDSYSVSGTTLTFSTAPASGRVITAYHSTTTVGGSNYSIATMTGDGSDTTLTLSTAPVHENNVQVYFDGVYQSKSNYSISGTTVTFTTAPPSGVTVEAITATNTSITTATQLVDADSDTMIQVEESSDEDKIRFDTGGTERMIIDSTGVGIGTSSPSSYNSNANKLVVAGSGNTGLTIAAGTADDNNIFFSDGTTGDAAYRGIFRYSHADDAFKFYTAGANERMRISSSGAVAIGQATHTGANVKLDLHNSGSGVGTQIAFYNDHNTSGHFIGAAGNTSGNIIYYNVANTAQEFYNNNSLKMTLDASGNLVVGNTAALGNATNRGNITINGSSDSILSLGNGGSLKGYILQDSGGMTIYSDGATYQRFYTNGSERMRIDSSGNLLIGKTTGASSVAGHRFNPNGSQESTASGTQPLYLNRLSSDGNIIVFDKDNTTVGSIGTAGGGAFYISDAAYGGLGFSTLGAGDINPVNTTGGIRDAAADLGQPTARFKDLYLSGGAYLGGTAAANKLDDYEEGTWTPELRIGNSTSGITHNIQSGKYVKIGRIVYIHCHCSLSSKGSNSGSISIQGLPFTPNFSTAAAAIPVSPRGKINVSGDEIFAYPSSTYFNLYRCNTSGGTNSNITNSHIYDDTDIDFNFVYYTDS